MVYANMFLLDASAVFIQILTIERKYIIG